MIGVGDDVVAMRDGGADRRGRPYQRPVKGQRYRVTGVYEMAYGLGCTLEGMDHQPYRGYLLFVKNGSKRFQEGWYFRKLVKDEEPASVEEGGVDILKKLREGELV